MTTPFPRTPARPAPRAPRPAAGALLALALAATPLPAQRVLLELRPAVGDTIRMRVEQQTEVHGQRKRGGSVDAASRLTMTLRLWSRAIVEQRALRATTLLTVTDSAQLRTTDPHGQAVARRTQEMLAGRMLRLRVAPDGTAAVLGDAEGDLSAMVAAMPAALPPKPVAVGEKWERSMPVPATNPLLRKPAAIRAVFRLDSLSADGALAWISVHGQLRPDEGGAPAEASMVGTVTGTILLNRRRGWLDQSQFAMEFRSIVGRPREAGAGAPMEITTRIIQRLRVEGRGGKP
ncbi:MAG TPA: DUF6263 family protein [Gemmatimonadaceae bacterium]|nr:DUF6263 family protein [Gemmatimonadaceae bacterium]